MIASKLNHIAFIMDGNGRWANARGLARLKGHEEGIKAVKAVVKGCLKQGIPFVSFYAFSSENWKRDKEEVEGLMSLLKLYFKNNIDSLNKEGIRIKIIGDLGPESRLEKSVIKILKQAEEKTKFNSQLTAIFAINYGGRDEIIRAAIDFALDVETGKRFISDMDETMFKTYLDTKTMPDPDLVVRTSGEQRLSNFLPWQATYSELMFLEKAWPDVVKEDVELCEKEFLSRNRRFGKAKENKEEGLQIKHKSVVDSW